MVRGLSAGDWRAKLRFIQQPIMVHFLSRNMEAAREQRAWVCKGKKVDCRLIHKGGWGGVSAEGGLAVIVWWGGRHTVFLGEGGWGRLSGRGGGGFKRCTQQAGRPALCSQRALTLAAVVSSSSRGRRSAAPAAAP